MARSSPFAEKVRRGLYVAVPVDVERPDLWTADPFVIATAVWSPCYITGWTAGNHWGLTEQVFRSVVVRTTNRVRSTEQTLLDHQVEERDPRMPLWDADLGSGTGGPA